MWKTGFFVALLAAGSYGIFNFLNQQGYFQHYFKHHPGICRQVKGLNFGSEDFQILSNGLTFVTSGLMMSLFSPEFKEFTKKHDLKGRVYAVDLNKSQVEAKELKIKPGESLNLSTFRPHGISVLEDTKKGQHLLYVVSHPDEDEDRVEKFRYLPASSELEHVKSFTTELFHITNDLAVTGEDTFYISDYLYFKTLAMHLIENLVHLKYGSLLYFNGTGFTPVATDLLGPNGVTLSKDKRYLYVTLPHSKSLNVYKVNTDTSLELVQEIDAHTGIDNLHLSQDGKSLYGGCHPIGLKIMGNLMNPNMQAPSQVLNFPLKDGKIDVNGISETLYDHGDLVSGSSIASVYNKKLLIGSVINKLAVCDMP